MPKQLIIFPFGGNAREALMTIFDLNEVKKEWEVVGFIDDDPAKWGQKACGIKVLGGRKVLKQYPNCRVLAIPGNPVDYLKRKDIIDGLKVEKSRFAKIIHPSACVSTDAKIGYNTLIMPNVVVSTGVKVGNHCIVLPNTTVSHDSKVGDYSCLGSNVSVSGYVKIGTQSYVCSGASIRDKISIGDNSLVGLAANVIKADVPPGEVWAGNPARFLRKVTAAKPQKNIQLKTGRIKKPRILFVGGTPRGKELLKKLIKLKENVVGAYILKEDDHEMIKVADEIKTICQRQKIPAKITRRINVDEVKEIISMAPQIAFVCGWRSIIPPELYKKIPLGCFAAHDSLLPRYKGFAPINWVIIEGETKTGVTLFKIEDGPVDSGPVFGQKEVAIGETETVTDIYPRIVKETIDLYQELLTAIRTGKIDLYLQDEASASFTAKRTPEDGKIDWAKPAQEVFNLIRALVPPYPCAWTHFDGKKIYISKASLPEKQIKYEGNIPGRIISVFDEGVLVLCGEGQIVVHELITESRHRVNANKLLESIKITLG